MTTANSWDNAENLLCIRLDAIGDVLMTTPAIRALRQSRPGRRVTLFASPQGAEIAELVPEIDHVIVYDAPWMKATAPRTNSRPEFDMIESLRQREFDAAVIFTVFSQNPLPSALLCYLAGIPLRLAHCHENPYQLLTNWMLDPEPGCGIRHEVRRQLDLVRTVGCQVEDERLSLQVPGMIQQVQRMLDQLGLDRHRPWVAIHAGATALSRRYSPEGFAEVARRLILEVGCQVVFTGTEAERNLTEQIQAGIGVASHSLAGCLSLSQMVALLAIAPLLIANNTGPVHIAAAVGTPVVDLYALTNPQHTPWGVPNRVLFHDVPCKFCYKSICPEGHYNCLRLVTPATIIQAVCELLAETKAGRTFNNSSGDRILTPSLSPTSYSTDPTTAVQSAKQVWR